MSREARPIVDPRRIEQLESRYLLALYLAAEKFRETDGPGVTTCHASSDIGRLAGLTAAETDRIDTALMKAGLINFDGGGPLVTFTDAGRDRVEAERFGKTWAARWRVVAGWAKGAIPGLIGKVIGLK